VRISPKSNRVTSPSSTRVSSREISHGFPRCRSVHSRLTGRTHITLTVASLLKIFNPHLLRWCVQQLRRGIHLLLEMKNLKMKRITVLNSILTMPTRTIRNLICPQRTALMTNTTENRNMLLRISKNTTTMTTTIIMEMSITLSKIKEFTQAIQSMRIQPLSITKPIQEGWSLTRISPLRLVVTVEPKMNMKIGTNLTKLSHQWPLDLNTTKTTTTRIRIVMLDLITGKLNYLLHTVVKESLIELAIMHQMKTTETPTPRILIILIRRHIMVVGMRSIEVPIIPKPPTVITRKHILIRKLTEALILDTVEAALIREEAVITNIAELFSYSNKSEADFSRAVLTLLRLITLVKIALKFKFHQVRFIFGEIFSDQLAAQLTFLTVRPSWRSFPNFSHILAKGRANI
jgi:hypothetical protein